MSRSGSDRGPFITNVCPMFYAETLADLEKPGRRAAVLPKKSGLLPTSFLRWRATPAHIISICV